MRNLDAAADMAPLIVIDIDGTLADPKHRLPILEGHTDPSAHSCLRHIPRHVLNDFMAPWRVAQDRPIEPAVAWLRRWRTAKPTRYLTGRWESLRRITDEWLMRNADWIQPFGDMRAGYQTELSAIEFKNTFLSIYPQGTLIIDDDWAVIKAARSFGHCAFHAPRCFNE